MFELAWPLVIFLLPLPIMARALLTPAAKLNSDALKVPFFEEISSIPQGMKSKASNRNFLHTLMWISWVFLVFATCRPQWVGTPFKIDMEGRNIMMAVDLSLSMNELDFEDKGRKINRLQVVKRVADKFIEKREGDRIGLILFGERAFLQAPLTFDRKTVRQLLKEAEIGLAGRSTSIGDAIGMTVKYLKDNKGKDEVLILLTDGSNTSGVMSPLEAAEIAAKENIKIYTIGVGSGAYKVNTLFGSRLVNPSRDLDEKTLTAVAEKTEGKYFRAKDTEELEEIYDIIDKLEPVKGDGTFIRPVKELFYYPLSLSIFVMLIIGLFKTGLISDIVYSLRKAQ